MSGQHVILCFLTRGDVGNRREGLRRNDCCDKKPEQGAELWVQLTAGGRRDWTSEGAGTSSSVITGERTGRGGHWYGQPQGRRSGGSRGTAAATSPVSSGRPRHTCQGEPSWSLALGTQFPPTCQVLESPSLAWWLVTDLHLPVLWSLLPKWMGRSGRERP